MEQTNLSDRRKRSRRKVDVSRRTIILCFVALGLVFVAQGLLLKKAIDDTAHQRRALLRQSVRSDYTLCMAINHDRKLIRDSLDDSIRTNLPLLKKLGILRTKQQVKDYLEAQQKAVIKERRRWADRRCPTAPAREAARTVE